MRDEPSPDPEPGIDHPAILAIAARVLPGSGPPEVSRPSSGRSTPVYRLRRAETTRYLRLGETPAADLGPEVRVHDRLLALGARVPEVVEYASSHPDLGRSMMVTTEVPGEPIGRRWQGVDVERILVAAGRDVATIASVPVEGFGWVRRDRPIPPGIAAELADLRSFAVGDLARHLAALVPLLGSEECRAIRAALAHEDAFTDAGPAALAHGDLDTTHIYHLDGKYSGIIDFGEIRGADRWYDLGHFALHEREHLPIPGTRHLLAGYHQVYPAAPDDAARMLRWAILIGVKTLVRIAGRPHGRYHAFLTDAVRRAVERLSA